MATNIDLKNLAVTSSADPSLTDSTASIAAERAAGAQPAAAAHTARLATESAQDGAQATAKANAVPLSLAEAPALPQASEPAATPSQTRTALASLGNLSDISAFAIIQQGQMKMLQLAGITRVAAQKAVISESLNAVKDLKDQIAGERKSAGIKLLGAFAGAATSMGVGIKGNAMRAAVDAPNTKNIGAGLDGSAQQVGNVVSSAFDLGDKLSGGGYQADQARIRQREDDVRKSMAQQVADSLKGSYDLADKAFSNAMQAFGDYFKRKEGLMSNIANQ